MKHEEAGVSVENNPKMATEFSTPNKVDEALHKVELSISKKGIRNIILSLQILFIISLIVVGSSSVVEYWNAATVKTLGIFYFILAAFLAMNDFFGIGNNFSSFSTRGMLMLTFGILACTNYNSMNIVFGSISIISSLVHLAMANFQSTIPFPVMNLYFKLGDNEKCQLPTIQ